MRPRRWCCGWSFGPAADRTGRYWSLTIAGYALTAVCVPPLALTPLLGAAGLARGGVLILAERIGKAVRSPAKSTLLAHAAGPVGLGRGFGVHKALDQVGAFAGPLLVAGVVALTGALWPALARARRPRRRRDRPAALAAAAGYRRPAPRAGPRRRATGPRPSLRRAAGELPRRLLAVRRLAPGSPPPGWSPSA